jgi:DNA-binding MarR family transcriptional regulator
MNLAAVAAVEGLPKLYAEVGAAVMEFQDASDQIDEAASVYLGLGRTEMRCLSVLMRGPLFAGELAAGMGMTRGAITALVDRLEWKQWVERQPVPGDRRRVRVALTAHAIGRVAEVYGPLSTEGFEQLATYHEDELLAIVRFLREGRDLNLRHAGRVTSMTPCTDPAAP